MAAITIAQVGAAVLSEIPKIMRDGFEHELQGRPDFIANGSPESLVGKVAQESARRICRTYAGSPGSFPGAKAANAETACRPYLDGIGQGAGPGVGVPFTGGQCPVNYTVEVRGTANIRDCFNNTTNSFPGLFNGSAGIRGPISGLKLALIGSGACGPTGSRVEGVDGNGSAFSFPGLNGTNQSNTVTYSGVNFTLIRDDGQPDSCGNPETEVRQPVPGPDPFPPPTRFNPEPGIDIPIDITINPDGSIGIDFGGGGGTADPFSPAPGADGGNDNSGIITPEPGTAGQSQDTGTGNGEAGVGGEAEGEAPAGQVLTGVKIDILTSPPDRVRYTTEVDRGVVYVYMGATEGLAFEPTGALVRSGQFFPAQKDYFTRWQVKARLGYDIRSTPYYRQKDGTATS